MTEVTEHAHTHGSQRAQIWVGVVCMGQGSAWVSPLEQRWGERCRMELRPSRSCPERYPCSLSSGVQEREWTPACPALQPSLLTGFLPSDADGV